MRILDSRPQTHSVFVRKAAPVVLSEIVCCIKAWFLSNSSVFTPLYWVLHTPIRQTPIRAVSGAWAASDSTIVLFSLGSLGVCGNREHTENVLEHYNAAHTQPVSRVSGVWHALVLVFSNGCVGVCVCGMFLKIAGLWDLLSRSVCICTHTQPFWILH